MKIRTQVLAGATLMALGLGGLAYVYADAASALPTCGGQGAKPQPVPYTCVAPGKTIDGTHVSAIVFVDGARVTVTYLLGAPRPVDTPIRITHHQGKSGAGLNLDSSSGVVRAGDVTATLIDSSPCRDGQLDIKFFFVTSGDARGRVGGPWIQNGTGCTGTTVPTTVAATTVASTAPQTSPTSASVSTPSTTAGPSPSQPAVVRPAVVTVPRTGTLVATGVGLDELPIVFVMIAVGGFLWGTIALGRRRSTA